MRRHASIVLSTALLSGCTTTQLKSFNDLPKERSRPVKAEADNWVIMFNGTNNEASQQAVNSLAQQCADKPVKVTLVENTFSFWLLPYLYKERISAHGYCAEM